MMSSRSDRSQPNPRQIYFTHPKIRNAREPEIESVAFYLQHLNYSNLKFIVDKNVRIQIKKNIFFLWKTDNVKMF